MERGIILLTISAYGIAVYLWWRERSPNYLIALLAGHTVALLSPLWQWLYGFSYNEQFIGIYTLFGRTLPRMAFIGAWTIMAPPLAIFYLFRRRWWFIGYLTSLMTFVLFVVYFLLIETIGVQAGWWRYEGQALLPLSLPPTFLAALMNGVISFVLLAALLMTRHYAWTSLLLLLPPLPLLLSLFIHGLLGAPLYTVILLRAQSWAGTIGMVGTLGLLLWGAHIVASALDQPNDGRLPV